MIQHDFLQGSPEWHAHRTTHLNASDAPAMLGCSPYVTRTQLLHRLHTGLSPEVDPATQSRFDDGHRFEALARPLAEEIVGEDLYPVTGSEGELSASFDGLTLLEETAFEHKTLNDELRACMSTAGTPLPKHYRVQMEQQLLVSGAERALFMASKWQGEPGNETLVEERHCWYTPDPALRAEIVAAWKQFAEDLAVYKPQPAAEPQPAGRAPETLPALRIEITGAVTASNLSEFKANALAVFAGINRTLTTDVEFADAEKTVKWCGEVEDRLKAAKEHALSQTASIDALFKTIDDISAESRRVRLDLDKLVTARKAAIKLEIVQEGKAAYEAHEAALRSECGAWTVLTPPDFAGCIKNLRTVDSIRNAVQTTLANAKIKADESARTIRAALAALDEESKGFEHLFRDRLNFINMIPEAVRLMVRDRIATHKAAEAKKEAETRERIRAEEQAKAEKDAREKLALEQRLRDSEAVEAARQAEIAGAVLAIRQREQEARDQEAARQAAEAAKPAPTPAPVQIASPAVVSQAPAANSPNVVPIQRAASASPPTLTLGQINERIGLAKWSEADLTAIGFPPAATRQNTKLYHEADFGRMLDSAIAHLRTVQAKQQLAA
jgi:putative phage-type endonuclease